MLTELVAGGREAAGHKPHRSSTRLVTGPNTREECANGEPPREIGAARENDRGQPHTRRPRAHQTKDLAPRCVCETGNEPDLFAAKEGIQARARQQRRERGQEMTATSSARDHGHYFLALPAGFAGAFLPGGAEAAEAGAAALAVVVAAAAGASVQSAFNVVHSLPSAAVTGG